MFTYVPLQPALHAALAATLYARWTPDSTGVAPVADSGFTSHFRHHLSARRTGRLVSIPVTNTSVNPARSTGVAVFVARAVLGAAIYRFIGAPAESAGAPAK